MKRLLLVLTVLCLGAVGAHARTSPTWRAAQPLLSVQDVAVLQILEEKGFGFDAIVGHPGTHTTQALRARSAVMRTIGEHLAADVASLRADMVANGRELDESRPGLIGGAFDARWLDSPIAHFSLAAVINRLDRQDFAGFGGQPTCGEVRLIYRLAYRTQGRSGIVASRLPFTANAVYDVGRDPDGTCVTAARAWVPGTDLADADQQAEHLIQGPLQGSRLKLRQIEVNAQVVRFPSGVEPGFGGQAAYLLRVFGIVGTGAQMTASVRPLENTPDVARLKSDEALRRDLVAYLRENVAAIDEGVYTLPDRFNATKALAFSTFGSARLGNRPFSAILSEADFAGLEWADRPLARSPAALMERLDNMTCQGCHQAGATAGFHVLGFDSGEVSSHNRVVQGGSPHFAAEQLRREAYAKSVLAGTTPSRFRPLSTAPAADWSLDRPRYAAAGTGMACLLRDKAAFGEAWSCGASETCETIAENPRLGVEYGQCMPKRETSGLACRSGRITTAAASYNDRMQLTGKLNSLAPRASAFAYNCRPPEIGVPGGLAYRQCSAADRAFEPFARAGAGELPAEICGLAGGKGFDRCVASRDVASCLHESVARGNRPTCGRERHCREDFICQALPDEVAHADRVPDDVGFCSPTYFVFQMRLDGHPDPSGERRAPRLR